MLVEWGEDLIYILFGSVEDMQDILIMLSIWLLIFFVIFKGAEKLFPTNRGIAALVAIIISFIGIRFMPEEWWESIMGLYTIVVGIALILGPYIILTIICDAARLGKTIKWILVIITYGALIYFLPMLGVIDLGSDALDTFFRYIGDHRLIGAGVFLAILVLLIMARSYIYRGAGYGIRGTRRFLGWVGRGGISGAKAIGRGAASGARYLGQGAAFGAGAAGAYGWRTGGNLWSRMMARRRAARAARAMMRGAARARGGVPPPPRRDREGNIW
ncbi:MAG: hypothetical protein QW404_00080 [Candidatus Nanoarchaeia archaeon]